MEPGVEHYGCLVDVLGRSGLLAEAMDTVRSMPMRPDSYVLGALLNACAAQGDVEAGEQVVRWLAELGLDHSGVHVQLSNMYAGWSKWEAMAVLALVGLGEAEAAEVVGREERVARLGKVLGAVGSAPLEARVNAGAVAEAAASASGSEARAVLGAAEGVMDGLVRFVPGRLNSPRRQACRDGGHPDVPQLQARDAEPVPDHEAMPSAVPPSLPAPAPRAAP